MNVFPALPMQAAQPQPGLDPTFFLMLGAIGLIWFFLVIRPQQQRQKAHEDSLKSAEKGDRVVTAGGLVGRIVSVADEEVTVEIGTVKGGGAVKVQVRKNRIDSVSKPGQKGGEGDKDAAAKKGDKGS